MNYNPNDFPNIIDNDEDDSIYDDMPPLISYTELMKQKQNQIQNQYSLNLEDESIYDDMPGLISMDEMEELEELENINTAQTQPMYRCISEPNINSMSYSQDNEYDNTQHRRKRFKSEPLESFQYNENYKNSENSESSENYEDIILISNKHLFYENYTASEYESMSREQCVNILVEMCQNSFTNNLPCPVVHCMCKICGNID